MAQLKSSPPLFPSDHLLARSFDHPDEQVNSCTESSTMGRSPLWEDSNTFGEDKKKELKELGQSVNESFARLSRVTGGPTKAPFKVRINMFV